MTYFDEEIVLVVRNEVIKFKRFGPDLAISGS